MQWVSSMISSVPVSRVSSRKASQEALIRQHHADIGHDGFSQHAGHIPVGQGCFEGWQCR